MAYRTEQMNMAYATDIVQRDASFCDEKCRSLMDCELNQLKVREFSLDGHRAKASGCSSTPTVGLCVHFGQWFQKFVEPGKEYCLVC